MAINNVILNYLKRLIIYEIIYKKIYKGEIDNVYIYKTKPSMTEYKLDEDYGDNKNNQDIRNNK